MFLLTKSQNFPVWSSTHSALRIFANFISESLGSINKLTLFHPEPYKIKSIVSNLIESDLIHISEDLPKIELNLTTKNGKFVID